MEKFNSQICTTRKQSERLLTLGLKKETADMHYALVKQAGYPEWDYFLMPSPITNDTFESIPAWSLHRLLELSPKSVDQEIPYFTKDGNVELVNSDGIVTKAFGGENLYDALLDFFYWLINKGSFNKEYLV